MIDRRWLYRIGGTLLLFSNSVLAGCVPDKGNSFTPGPDEKERTGMMAETPIPATEFPSEQEVIVNGLTGAIYQVVPDPTGEGKRCVRLGLYSSENKQTVVGAAVALGPDPNIYVDVEGGVVYSKDGQIIGYFERGSLPDPELFGNVPPGTIVCVLEQ